MPKPTPGGTGRAGALLGTRGQFLRGSLGLLSANTDFCLWGTSWQTHHHLVLTQNVLSSHCVPTAAISFFVQTMEKGYREKGKPAHPYLPHTDNAAFLPLGNIQGSVPFCLLPTAKRLCAPDLIISLSFFLWNEAKHIAILKSWILHIVLTKKKTRLSYKPQGSSSQSTTVQHAHGMPKYSDTLGTHPYSIHSINCEVLRRNP